MNTYLNDTAKNCGADDPFHQFKNYIVGAIISQTDGTTKVIEDVADCSTPDTHSIIKKVKSLSKIHSFQVYICAVLENGQRTGRYFIDNNIPSPLKIN